MRELVSKVEGGRVSARFHRLDRVGPVFRGVCQGKLTGMEFLTGVGLVMTGY